MFDRIRVHSFPLHCFLTFDFVLFYNFMNQVFNTSKLVVIYFSMPCMIPLPNLMLQAVAEIIRLKQRPTFDKLKKLFNRIQLF
jgi:hypothetical protein